MSGVFRFLAGSTGRMVRALAGVVLIVIGLALVHGVFGWILAIIGLVPLAAGVFDVCVFAPLMKLPFAGSQLRRSLEQ